MCGTLVLRRTLGFTCLLVTVIMEDRMGSEGDGANDRVVRRAIFMRLVAALCQKSLDMF